MPIYLHSRNSIKDHEADLASNLLIDLVFHCAYEHISAKQFGKLFEKYPGVPIQLTFYLQRYRDLIQVKDAVAMMNNIRLLFVNFQLNVDGDSLYLEDILAIANVPRKNVTITCKDPKLLLRVLKAHYQSGWLTTLEVFGTSVTNLPMLELVQLADRMGVHTLRVGEYEDADYFPSEHLSKLFALTEVYTSHYTKTKWDNPLRDVYKALFSARVVPRLAPSQPIQTLPIELFQRLRGFLI